MNKLFQNSIDRYDIVPVYNIWTYGMGATSSDNWYACIIGDDPIPDFHISRISIISAEQILPIAQKSLHYLENRNFEDKWHSSITLIAGDRSNLYSQQHNRIRNSNIPRHFFANRIFRIIANNPQAYFGDNNRLFEAINNGTSYVQYMGHGGGGIWSDVNLLTSSDVPLLSNKNYPIVIALTCLSSAFQSSFGNTIGELFISEPEKGAIMHFGFSGVGFEFQIEDSGNFISDAFFNRNFSSLGEITTYQKIRYYAIHRNNRTWMTHVHSAVMMGDPMLYHYVPERVGTVNLKDNKLLVEPGETITVQAQFPNDIYTARCLILDNFEVPINTPVSLPVVNGSFEYEFTIPADMPETQMEIKIIAAGPNREVATIGSFSVGNSIFYENTVIPTPPTEKDEIEFRVKLVSSDEIENFFVTVWFSGFYQDYIMTYNQNTSFWESGRLRAFPAGTLINYRYTAEPNNNRSSSFHPNFIEAGTRQISNITLLEDEDDEPVVYISRDFQLRILAPDLALESLELIEKDGVPGFIALIFNVGDLPSTETTLTLKTGGTIHSSKSIPPININESILEFIALPENPENLYNTTVTAVVNDFSADFGEYRTDNNAKNYHITNLYFKAGLNELFKVSNDNNFEITFPSGFLSQEAWFSLSIDDFIEPHLQPDVERLELKNGLLSPIYTIDLLNKSILADSLGTFPDNKRLHVSFNYLMIEEDDDDDDEDDDDKEEYIYNFSIYKWNNYTRKWVYQESIIDEANQRVYATINKIGTYTVLRNFDDTLPSIEISIGGQDYVVGGTLSTNSVISFVFSDENGIDIIDNPIILKLNGDLLDPKEYSLSAIPEHTNNIPLKYHLSVPRGDYSLEVSCFDVNGNFNQREFSFRISDRFDLVRVANYPNPISFNTIDPVNSGRTRFTYTLTDDADSVELKIYTVSGRLVKTFKNLPSHVGYHEFPRTIWGYDCRDEAGYFLANGVYFYKITAKKGSKEISRTERMAILK